MDISSDLNFNMQSRMEYSYVFDNVEMQVQGNVKES